MTLVDEDACVKVVDVVADIGPHGPTQYKTTKTSKYVMLYSIWMFGWIISNFGWMYGFTSGWMVSGVALPLMIQLPIYI